ncbi:MAG: hypothetical protein ABSA97_09415 [Verrucomicrobiia bacterium]
MRIHKFLRVSSCFHYLQTGNGAKVTEICDLFCQRHKQATDFVGKHVGQTVTCCGLIVEDRIHQQVTSELMKFLTLADWTGIVETELFADTYRSYGLATVRYPVLEVTATVEPFENGNGYSLQVHRAGKPRTTRNS